MSTSDKLLSVLNLFDVDRPDWSVEEAAATLGLAVSTTYRYFASLSAAGLIAPFLPARYVLGPAIIRYDRQLRLTDPLVSAAHGEMRRLSRVRSGRTVVFLCRLLGGQVMCVHQITSGDASVAVGYERGRLMPLFAGSASKVILAQLPPRQVRALFDRQPERFAATGLGDSWPAVRDALREIRTAGYLQTEAEVDPGMRGISVPIVEPASAVIASLSVAGRAADISKDDVDTIREELRVSGERVRARLGRMGSPTAEAV